MRTTASRTGGCRRVAIDDEICEAKRWFLDADGYIWPVVVTFMPVSQNVYVVYACVVGWFAETRRALSWAESRVAVGRSYLPFRAAPMWHVPNGRTVLDSFDVQLVPVTVGPAQHSPCIGLGWVSSCGCISPGARAGGPQKCRKKWQWTVGLLGPLSGDRVGPPTARRAGITLT